MLSGYLLLIDNYSTNTNKHQTRSRRNEAPPTKFDAGLQPARTNWCSHAQHGGLPITFTFLWVGAGVSLFALYYIDGGGRPSISNR